MDRTTTQWRLVKATATVVAAALLALAPAALGSGCGSSGGQSTASPSPIGERAIATRQVVDLVDATCAAIEKDAPATFVAIEAGEAPYVDPSNPALYVFVFDTSVKVVAHPEPAMQGRDLKGVPDAAGKMFRDEMIANAVANGSGWVEYVREMPGEQGLFRKTAYFKLVTGSDGIDYVVGAGRYLGPWEGTPQAGPTAAASD